MKLISIFLLVFLFALPGYATAVDSVHVSRNDTIDVRKKTFDKELRKKFNDDPEFRYGRVAEGMSWFDRVMNIFLQWIWGFIRLITNTLAGRTIFYLLLSLLLLYVIIKLLNIDIKDLFYRSARAQAKFKIAEENIHEIDFDKLVKEAIDARQFRIAVRLIFLHSLKKLSDAQLIQWVPGKTNDDYLNELANHPARQRVQELRYYFDYAWYGNFEINDRTFRHVHQTFDDLTTTLK